MTKTLTEQWRDGKLPDGCYYIVHRTNKFPGNDEIEIVGTEYLKTLSEFNGTDRAEVLAPVPSYEEYQDIIQQNVNQESAIETYIEEIKRLQEQLEISIKALKDCYNDMKYWAVLTHRNQRILNVIKKALKEMEGVK